MFNLAMETKTWSAEVSRQVIVNRPMKILSHDLDITLPSGYVM
jgi:hypothetical protein